MYEDKKKGTKTTYAPGRFTASFAEIDDRPIPEQHALLDACPLPPSIRVETRKSVHAYWLLDNSPGDQCEADWREVQARFIAYFGSDDKIKNPARLMRLPFFNHLKLDTVTRKNTATKVKGVAFEPERRYALAELLAAFSPAPEEKQDAKTGSKSKQRGTSGFATWGALRVELGRRIMAHSSAQQNSSGKWDCKAICHDGKGDTGLFYDPSNNQSVYNGGCNQATVLRAFGLPEKPDPPEKKKAKADNRAAGEPEQEDADEAGGKNGAGKDPLSLLLIKLALGNSELFHDAGGERYASVTVTDHRETHKLGSRDYKDWLAGLLYRTAERTATGDKVSEAVTVLRAKARYESPEIETHVRVAEHDGAIYLDLCNKDWQQVEITETDWRVIESKDSPVRFRRASGMLALPVPERGGELCELRELLNLPAEDTDNWPLLLGWLVAAFKPCNVTRFAYPLLTVHGEQGSAKSTTCRLLRRLIDPNKADLRATPRDERDLAIAAEHGRVPAFDNITYLSDSLSNALCRLATGGGFATRELFTDEGEIIFDSQRPVILNGIAEVVSKSDLLDRSILIYLPQIDRKMRKLDRVIDREFTKAQPRILGAVLDAISKGLRRRDIGRTTANGRLR